MFICVKVSVPTLFKSEQRYHNLVMVIENVVNTEAETRCFKTKKECVGII